MKKSALAVAALVLCAGSAFADIQTYEATLTPGAVNGPFPLNAAVGDIITASVWDFAPNASGDQSASGIDSLLRVIAPTLGNADDDDTSVGRLSVFVSGAPEAGIYNALVSGFPDTAFIGDHSQSGRFRLVMTSAPSALEAGSANNDAASAQNLIFSNGAARTDGELADPDGDVDWYAFNVVAGDLITAEVFGSLDTTLGLFAPDGTTLLAFDDDDTDGLNSALYYLAPASGTYYVAVSGFSDFVFDGAANGEAGFYQLIVSGGATVPTPGALGLLGLAGMVAARRRR